VDEFITTRDVRGTRLITMDRPQVHNAMNLALAAQLHAVLRDTADDAAVASVILSGSGTTFSAGLDVKELASDGGELLALVTSPETNPFRALRALPQPVIAAVNGPAITGGLELVLGCDVVLASSTATFADTHAKVGVMPAQGMAALLSAAVGVPLAKWMSFTGRALTGAEAMRAGLVSQVVDPDQLLSAAYEVAEDLWSTDQATLRSVKRLYEQGLEGTRAEWSELEQSMFGQGAAHGTTASEGEQ
jgi:enoyl-CoA hydratase